MNNNSKKLGSYLGNVGAFHGRGAPIWFSYNEIDIILLIETYEWK
jgi:hypothetical protein